MTRIGVKSKNLFPPAEVKTTREPDGWAAEGWVLNGGLTSPWERFRRPSLSTIGDGNNKKKKIK